MKLFRTAIILFFIGLMFFLGEGRESIVTLLPFVTLLLIFMVRTIWIPDQHGNPAVRWRAVNRYIWILLTLSVTFSLLIVAAVNFKFPISDVIPNLDVLLVVALIYSLDDRKKLLKSFPELANRRNIIVS